ncbi:hypothetical protein [Streptomyces mutabilis]|nr:hypothetical protein [Streptomyces mutabilis]
MDAVPGVGADRHRLPYGGRLPDTALLVAGSVVLVLGARFCAR